jgi:hypothetical protein
MRIKRKFAIFSIILGCVLVLLILVGGLSYKFIFAPLFGERELPPELREARIITGADFLTKSEVYQAGKNISWLELRDPNKLKSRFESIRNMAVGQLDGQPGADIGVVGMYGVTLLDRQGNFKERINYQFQKGTIKLGPFKLKREKDSFYEMALLDLEGDGVCEILGHDGLDGATVFNHRGQVVFSRGEYADGKSSIKELAAGDLDGDGKLEFVASWGYEPWIGIELFDRFGNSRWRREEESKPGPFEIADVSGDGRAEIVEDNGMEIIIRDAQGKMLSHVKMPVYLWHLSLCARADGQGAPQNLAVREGSLWLIDLDGKNFSKFDAPLSEIKLAKPREVKMPGDSDSYKVEKEEVFRAKGVWTRLKKDQPKYLAVIASFSVLDRSLFYIYDEQGKLVYQEVLPEDCNAIAILPPENDGDSEELMIGGDKTIWRYRAH